MSTTAPADDQRDKAHHATPASAARASSSASTGRSPQSGAPAEERDLWRGRMSWKRHAGIGIAWLCCVVPLMWCWWRFHGQIASPWFDRIIFLLILGSGVAAFVRSALLVYGTAYRLTTQRLFVERGILGRTTDQMELIRVDDVRVRQTLFDRIFGLGQVELMSTDATEPAVRLVGIREPHAVAEHIRNNTRALRAQRSLFVEQI